MNHHKKPTPDQAAWNTSAAIIEHMQNRYGIHADERVKMAAVLVPLLRRLSMPDRVCCIPRHSPAAAIEEGEPYTSWCGRHFETGERTIGTLEQTMRINMQAPEVPIQFPCVHCCQAAGNVLLAII